MEGRDPRRLASRLVPWVAVGLLFVGFLLRTHGLATQELTFDEVASVFVAGRGPLGLLNYVRGAIREHPPFYYLFLWLWMPLVGRSEFAVRFLSVIIGMMTVAAVYRMLRERSRPQALLTTLLLATSPFHIRISRSARMYGMLAMWTLLSISAFILLLQKNRRHCRSSLLPNFWSQREMIARTGLFWLVTGLGMFTHYFMAFVLVAQDLFLLLSWRRHRSLLRPWMVVHAGLGLLVTLWAVLSPGLWATLLSLWERGMASTVRWEALARALNGLYLGAMLGPNWHRLALPLIMTVLGLLPFWRRNQSLFDRQAQDGLLLGLLIGVPIAAALALPERIVDRYLTTALPAVVLAMGAGLGKLFSVLKDRLLPSVEPRFRMFAACVVVVGILSGILFLDIRAYPSVYYPSGESFRAKMEYLHAHARSDDGLLLHGPWQQLLLSYYDAGAVETYTIPLRGLDVDTDLIDESLSQIFRAHERVWVSYSSVDPVDPDGLVARWLHDHAHEVLSHKGLTLYYRAPTHEVPTEVVTQASDDTEVGVRGPYHRMFLPAIVGEGDNGYERVERVAVDFDKQLRLVGVALSNLELVAGEGVLFLCGWETIDTIPPGLTMRLELVSLDNQVWQDYQFETGPAHIGSQAWGSGETFIERRGLVIPVGTPPGEYRLRLRVLSPAGNEWLPKDGRLLQVGSVRVRHYSPSQRAIRALPGRGLRAEFGRTIALIGYAPWGLDFTQGNPLLFDTYWEALDAPGDDYELQIEVVQEGGTVLARKRVQLVADWCPTSSWKRGGVLKGHHMISLPVDAPSGPYWIRLSVIASDGSPLPVDGMRTHQVLDWWTRKQTLTGTGLVLFEGKIEARPRRYHPPAMEHHADAVLGTTYDQVKVQLLGYDLASTAVEPGESVELTLYWKTLRRMDRVYAVFNHLVASDGTVLAQQDGWPLEGAYNTDQWLPGEVVEDYYAIDVPGDAQPGEYALRVGMYDAATKERLLTTVDGTLVPERYAQLAIVTVEK